MRKTPMHLLKTLINCIILTSLLSFGPVSFAGKLYKWVDKNGNFHFSDSPAGIPDEYRDQVEVDEYRDAVKSRSEPEPLTNAKEQEPGMKSEKKGDGDLKQYEIPYIAFEGSARRIIVPVTFNGTITAKMALDTGAPGMVITPQLAERLGLFEANEGMLMITTGGIGGTAPAIRTIIDSIKIGGAMDKFIPTTVVPLEISAFEGLIGMDFMSGYSIHIDPRRRVVIFKEMPPDPNSSGGHNEEWWRTKFWEFSTLRNEWKEYIKNLDKAISESAYSSNSDIDKIKKARKFAEFQYGEADKLFFKLNSLAVDNAVPMSWRKY